MADKALQQSIKRAIDGLLKNLTKTEKLDALYQVWKTNGWSNNELTVTLTQPKLIAFRLDIISHPQTFQKLVFDLCMASSHIYKPLDTDTSALYSYKFNISEDFMTHTMKFLNIAVKEKGSEDTQLKEVRNIFKAQVQDSL